uniref:lysozyme n=1 Tax=Varanus komodoensis TaxID=61221 RepID=A0A8D2JHZ7_VARKO
MKLLLFLGLSLLAVLVVPSAEGKIFQRCELARVLKQHQLEGFVGRKVADWVCLAQHESSYNTAAVHDNGRSRDYGIFQINKLLDDNIADDIACGKQIAREARGLTPWKLVLTPYSGIWLPETRAHNSMSSTLR